MSTADAARLVDGAEVYTPADAERARRNGADRQARPVPRALSVSDLLTLEIPRREFLLEPIIREKETAMVHAWRGIGKTHVGLEIGFAVASGGSYLRWNAPRPRPVLYIDGEMPARTMQERLAAIVKASDRADEFDPAHLQLVCADLQDAPLPNLPSQPPASRNGIETRSVGSSSAARKTSPP